VEPSLQLLGPFIGLFYHPWMINNDSEGIFVTNNGNGNRSTYMRTALVPTNCTWLDQGSNPVRRGGKSAPNYLSYGTALLVRYK
jgi:hypothetical protein